MLKIAFYNNKRISNDPIYRAIAAIFLRLNYKLNWNLTENCKLMRISVHDNKNLAKRSIGNNRPKILKVGKGEKEEYYVKHNTTKQRTFYKLRWTDSQRTIEWMEWACEKEANKCIGKIYI